MTLNQYNNTSNSNPTESESGLRNRGIVDWAALLVAFCVWMGGGVALAQTSIVVPNASFESPSAPFEIPYATELLDAWEKTPEPVGYDPEIGQGPWEQKSGVFLNIPAPVPIDNMDGAQGAFLFSYPGAGFFQDYDSLGGTNTLPSHEFDATFEVGKSYQLIVGFTTSTYQPVMEGATLRMGLYYRDLASNRVSVAEAVVTYSTNLFLDPFHLYDYQVVLPEVSASDAWAGEHIGVEVVSTVSSNLLGGVWDLDNVRLVEFISPTLAQPGEDGSQFHFTLLSTPGAVLEVLATTDSSMSISNWTALATLTNSSGATNFMDATPGLPQRFYTAREVP